MKKAPRDLRVTVWAAQFVATLENDPTRRPDIEKLAASHADEAVDLLDSLLAEDSKHLAAWKRRSPRGGDA